MNFIKSCTIALLVLVCTGCVTASVSRLNNTQRAPIPPSEVTIYLEEEDVPSEFEKMAIIDLSGSSGWTNQEDIYERARKEAAEIGANGVLFRNYEEAGTGERVASALFGTYSDNDAEMVAIYVMTDEEPEASGSESDDVAMEKGDSTSVPTDAPESNAPESESTESESTESEASESEMSDDTDGDSETEDDSETEETDDDSR